MQTLTQQNEPASQADPGADRTAELQEAFNDARDAVRESLRVKKLADEKIARLRQLQLEASEHEQVAA